MLSPNYATAEHSENLNELFGALAKAQGSMSAASKDAKNPFYKSTYADLTSVSDACRDALSKQSICVVQTTKVNENGDMFLVTTLGHISGQWIKSVFPIKIKTEGQKLNDMQQLGSTLTYLRRYSLAAISGVVPGEPDDDDGNEGGKTTAYATPTKKQIEDFNVIFNQCDPKYQSAINESLAKRKKSLTGLNMEEYSSLLQAAISNREDYKKRAVENA